MSDKWTKEDEDLYQKKYEESLKELQPYDNGFFKRNLMKDVDKALASKAMKGMVNYAKDKDYNDKEQAVEDALLAVGATSGAVKGAKDAKNAKTKAVPKAGKVADAVGEKMAAGAEGMSFTTPRESIDTHDLSANQYQGLKNSLNDATRKLGVGDFELDPTVDVSELDGKVINDLKRKPNKQLEKLKLSQSERQEGNSREGYETSADRKAVSKMNYRRMMKEPEQTIPGKEVKDTHVLDNSIKLKDGTVVETNHDTPKPKANAQQEQQRVIEIAKFMKDLEKTHPDWVKNIRANMRDLHLRDKKTGPRVDERLAKGLTSDKKLGGERNEELLRSRVAPIANEMAQMMPEENLIGYGRRALGDKFVDSVLKNANKEQAKKQIATGLAMLTASMMYSEDGDDKLANKIVKANQEQLSGKNAPAWVKDKAKVWDNWLDTFDASKMENEDDYKAYLEATQLVDDYKRGGKILTQSGNTHPMAELLTNPKYVKLLTKYSPDDAKRVFGK